MTDQQEIKKEFNKKTVDLWSWAIVISAATLVGTNNSPEAAVLTGLVSASIRKPLTDFAVDIYSGITGRKPTKPRP